MSYLLDTNVLLRLVEPAHPRHQESLAAVSALFSAGEEVQVFPQNIAEFWNVCTRPIDKNGLGNTPAQADLEVGKIETLFWLVLDSPNIYPEWRQRVLAYSISGVQVHDARLASAMKIHGTSHIVTFNDRDFMRFRDITVMTPLEVVKSYQQH